MDDFGGISVHWFIVSALLTLSSVGWAQALPTSNAAKSALMAKPTVLPATDGIFAAFQIIRWWEWPTSIEILLLNPSQRPLPIGE